ncbi:tetratricopeptide repeat protein [Pararhizobium sp. O133]|uniref:tetratricopeptide repeat protein n=1 Tax=Pararhizobium sp. O133 TaxID=3449278 RepID=UPI003F685416
MANQDDSFIREVNEELRSEQVKAVWTRFGSVIVGIAILIVLGTIGKVGYEYWHETSASKSGDQFLAALTLSKENKTDEAIAALNTLEKDGYGAYPVLAKMRAATMQAQKGDVAGAVQVFSDISKDASLPQAMRDAARARAAYLLVDTGTYEQVSAEVEQLAVPGNGLRHSAREALGLAAYKSGDMAKAKTWFQQIADDQETPRNLANRAQMLLDLITASGKAS